VEGCLRQIGFLDREIAEVDRALAEAAIDSPEMRRPMSVPGVNLHTAATFMACVGNIHRFESPRELVSYLGLDPKVRQSGEERARHSHISKEGASAPGTCSARRPGSWSATRARCGSFSLQTDRKAGFVRQPRVIAAAALRDRLSRRSTRTQSVAADPRPASFG
jgi:Transposase IS116/IS110/IS902 family